MDEQPTPSSSRFAHFNQKRTSELNGHNEHGNQGNDAIGNDTVRVSTGIVYRSTPNGHEVSQLAGSFISADMNGHNPPTNVETFIVQPDCDQPDGPNKIITARPNSGAGIVGKVTFNPTQIKTHDGVYAMQQQNRLFNNFQQHSFSLPDPQPSFEITVKTLNTAAPYHINVKGTDTLDQLKEHISEKCKIPVKQQILLYGGQQLVSNNKDGKTLGEYGIKKNSQINVVLRLRGG